METHLRIIGNSKGVIIPKKLIQKYNLDSIILEDVENGILIRPGENESLFEKKLREARNNKKMIYSNLKNSVAEMTEGEHSSYELESEEFNDLEIID